MMTLAINKSLIASALLLISLNLAADTNTLLGKAWEYIENKNCDTARKLFNPPVSSPEEQCIYAKSICCSDIKNIKNQDIDDALNNLDTSLAKLGRNDIKMSRWIEDAKSQCRELRQTLANSNSLTREAMITARQNKAQVWSNYSGKVMSRCQQENISPFLVGGGDAANSKHWHYVTPRFGESGNVLAPTEAYLQSVLNDYVDKNPAYEICAPFIAVSSTQDPKHICKAAHDFMEYFNSTYQAKFPPTWITLYHYPSEGKQIMQHAERTTGSMKCEGVLGFFDWRRQSVVFRAPAGFFGTFDHELTHALMFWDIPLAPSWLEEGIASMYEHTDPQYRSLENPWRSRVLARNNITDKTVAAAFFGRVLRESLLEFEASPLGATISREVMRKLQQCGDLPGLYKEMRNRSAQSAILDEYQREPHLTPEIDTVTDWEKLVGKFTTTGSGASCL